MNIVKGLDAYERPEMEEFYLSVEKPIAASQITETIDDDPKEHGWGGNN